MPHYTEQKVHIWCKKCAVMLILYGRHTRIKSLKNIDKPIKNSGAFSYYDPVWGNKYISPNSFTPSGLGNTRNSDSQSLICSCFSFR